MLTAVLGAGSMGTAVSLLLNSNNNEVKIWTKFADEAAMINESREQKEKLPGIHIPDEIECSTDIEYVVKNSGIVVLAVPSQTVRETAARIRKHIGKDTIIVCISKGLEENTGLRMSQVISQEIKNAKPVMLSGPCHSEELARGIPTAYVASSLCKRRAKKVQGIFMTPTFRVYTNWDLAGVELGGALKNIIALGAGISDGLGFGDNTKAALMTRGIAEIQRLGVLLGAKPETFSGLTGIGDLIVTCTSMHSRNRVAGIMLGQGMDLNKVLDEVKMVVEGVATTKAAFNLAKIHDVDMPITNQIYKILFERKNPRDAVSELMTRRRKDEMA